jgi:hypothetical protein
MGKKDLAQTEQEFSVRIFIRFEETLKTMFDG